MMMARARARQCRAAHRRAWSSDASSRRSRRDETGSRMHARTRNASTGKSLPSASNSAPARKLKSLAVPVIDMIRPVRADRRPGGGRADRVISDLRAAFRMRRDLGAELLGEHLRAQANSQKRPLLPQRHAIQSISRRTIIVGIVGAHRAAENHCAGMVDPAFPAADRRSAAPDIEGCPSARSALPTRPGVEVSWCRTIRTGKRGGPAAGSALACSGYRAGKAENSRSLRGLRRLKRHRLSDR